MDNLDVILQNAEALPDDIRSTAEACAGDLELQLKLSLHWVAARKLAEALRALVQPQRPVGPPALHIVR